MKAYAMNLRVRGVADSLVRLAAGRVYGVVGHRWSIGGRPGSGVCRAASGADAATRGQGGDGPFERP